MRAAFPSDVSYFFSSVCRFENLKNNHVFVHNNVSISTISGRDQFKSVFFSALNFRLGLGRPDKSRSLRSSRWKFPVRVAYGATMPRSGNCTRAHGTDMTSRRLFLVPVGFTNICDYAFSPISAAPVRERIACIGERGGDATRRIYSTFESPKRVFSPYTTRSRHDLTASVRARQHTSTY